MSASVVTSLTGLHQPVCGSYDRPWLGASSYDQATATTNARLHNEHAHADDQGELW